MPGDSGVLVVTRVRSITPIARGRGCSGHPAFPTPSFGARDKSTARALRAASTKLHVDFMRTCRHCEERLVRRSSTREGGKRRSNPAFCFAALTMDCFAWLAMTQNSLRPGCLKIESQIRTSICAEALSSPPCGEGGPPGTKRIWVGWGRLQRCDCSRTPVRYTPKPRAAVGRIDRLAPNEPYPSKFTAVVLAPHSSTATRSPAAGR
jgi:hypothetical protein